MRCSLRTEAEQRRRFFALLQKMDPAIAKAFAAAIRRRASTVAFGELVKAIEANRIEDAIQMVAVRPSDALELTEAVRSAYLQGGQSAAFGSFGFDGNNPAALAWARDKAANLITSIGEESRQSARALIMDAIENPRSSRSVALDLVGRRVGQIRTGGVIGLSSSLTQAIIGARRKLISDPKAYLKLKLRDKRFDRMIRKAIKEGRALTASEVQAVMLAHESKALAYRGRVVAATEAHQALHAGQYEAMRQMVLSGAAEGFTKKWMHGLSADPRLDHLAMDGEVRPFNVPFIMGDGTPMQFPHDPAGGAEHSIGCKCVLVYREIVSF